MDRWMETKKQTYTGYIHMIQTGKQVKEEWSDEQHQ